MFELYIDNLRRGDFCSECRSTAKQAKFFEGLMETLQNTDIECLEKTYVNAKTIMKWKCRNGHTIHSTYDGLKTKSFRCYKCFGGLEQKRTLEDAKMMASMRGGKCLSKEYATSKTSLEWKCEYGHQWKARCNIIAGVKWCPQCFKYQIDHVDDLDGEYVQWTGGKVGGNVDERKVCVRVRFNGHGKPRVFHFKDFLNRKTALESAQQYRKEKSDELGFTRNKWRFIDRNRIEMQLTQGKTAFLFYKDLSKVIHLTWFTKSCKTKELHYVYAMCIFRGKRQSPYMHRLIAPNHSIVDHIDGNGLNDVSLNLRDGSNGVNARNCKLRKDNTSGENGITDCPKEKRYAVQWLENKKTRKKSFPYRSMEKMTAFQLAINYRDEIVYPRIKNENGRRK